MDPEPLLRSAVVGGQLVVSAGGAWTAGHARELELLVDGLGRDESGATTLSLDMRGVEVHGRTWLVGAALAGDASAAARDRLLASIRSYGYRWM